MRKPLSFPMGPVSEVLTQREFTQADHKRAAELARRLGYSQTLYTSTSSLCGLQCLKENPENSKGPRVGGFIIRTAELGLLFVQCLEDLNAWDLHEQEHAELRRWQRQQDKKKKAEAAEKGGAS